MTLTHMFLSIGMVCNTAAILIVIQTNILQSQRINLLTQDLYSLNKVSQLVQDRKNSVSLG